MKDNADKKPEWREITMYIDRFNGRWTHQPAPGSEEVRLIECAGYEHEKQRADELEREAAESALIGIMWGSEKAKDKIKALTLENEKLKTVLHKFMEHYKTKKLTNGFHDLLAKEVQELLK